MVVNAPPTPVLSCESLEDSTFRLVRQTGDATTIATHSNNVGRDGCRERARRVADVMMFGGLTSTSIRAEGIFQDGLNSSIQGSLDQVLGAIGLHLDWSRSNPTLTN